MRGFWYTYLNTVPFQRALWPRFSVVLSHTPEKFLLLRLRVDCEHFQAPDECSVDEVPHGKYTASTSRACRWVNEDKAKVQKRSLWEGVLVDILITGFMCWALYHNMIDELRVGNLGLRYSIRTVAGTTLYCIAEVEVSLTEFKVRLCQVADAFPVVARKLSANTFARHILDDSNMAIPLRLAPRMLLNCLFNLEALLEASPQLMCQNVYMLHILLGSNPRLLSSLRYVEFTRLFLWCTQAVPGQLENIQTSLSDIG